MRFRCGLFFIFLASATCRAEDVPDPGRRLSEAEQHADSEKQTPRKQPGPFDPPPKPRRDSQACEGARSNYQLSCKAVGMQAQHSRACAEAYAIYQSSCP